MKMTTEEAFVKTLQMHGIDNAFGIIGSAMMPISDIFPDAGIKFWDCAHETSGGMMADGYTRATGKMCMMIAQNGPGITNFVTAVKTAYWNHTPVLLVTPQAANKTIGQGGFQEMEQMNLFADCVAYQEEVRDPSRIAETLNRVIMQAKRASGPAQTNIPRDFWTQVIDWFDLRFSRPYDRIMDLDDGPEWARWCTGGTTNLVANCLDRQRGTDVAGAQAILWEGEDGTIRRWTYAELDAETSRIAAGLERLGYGPGDAIGIYMPMLPEMVAAFLAVLRIGGVAVPLFSGFGLGTLLLPAFALFFPVEVAVGATAVVHLANNLFKLTLVGRHADRASVIAFGGAALIGAMLGALLLGRLTGLPDLLEYNLGGRTFSMTWARSLVGALILIFAVLELAPAAERLAFPRRFLPVGGLVLLPDASAGWLLAPMLLMGTGRWPRKAALQLALLLFAGGLLLCAWAPTCRRCCSAGR